MAQRQSADTLGACPVHTYVATEWAKMSAVVSGEAADYVVPYRQTEKIPPNQIKAYMGEFRKFFEDKVGIVFEGGSINSNNQG